MSEDKYNRLPQAGDLERKDGVDFIYLSPRPTHTGLPPFSTRQLHREANETYLDFALGRGNFEFMSRVGIGVVMFFTTFLFLVTGYLSWLRRKFEPFLSSWWEFFTGPVVWTIVLSLAALYSIIFYLSVRQITVHPPIRFNRERREVAFVTSRGSAPRYVAWEKTIACVTSGKLITQYAVIPEFKIMIGLFDDNTGDILWSSISSGNLGSAISEWEAIRAYMEEGPSVLPPQQTDELEEGSVAFFHLCRRTYRKEHSYLRYLWGFVTIQFFSGWTLPCYISGWVNKRPKAGFPKEVLDWSRPLPSDQHAKPSEELLHESAEVFKAFSNGQSLLDYFKIEHSNSGHCEEKKS
ncbi:hypothetical protein ABHN98_20805 [Pseudomonas syringae]